MARLHDLKHFDIENTLFGPAVSLWFNHCPFHCEGCWNSQTWEIDETLARPNHEIIAETLEALDAYGLEKHLSLLGGDPLSPLNIDDTIEILEAIKEKRPQTKVLCWSGYLYEHLLRMKKHQKALTFIDVLVDGRFIQELKVEHEKLFGSSNQRVIDVPLSLEKKEIVLYDYE